MFTNVTNVTDISNSRIFSAFQNWFIYFNRSSVTNVALKSSLHVLYVIVLYLVHLTYAASIIVPTQQISCIQKIHISPKAVDGRRQIFFCEKIIGQGFHFTWCDPQHFSALFCVSTFLSIIIIRIIQFTNAKIPNQVYQNIIF